MVVSRGFVKGQPQTFFFFLVGILQLFVFSLYFYAQMNFFFRIYTRLPDPNHPAHYNLEGPKVSSVIKMQHIPRGSPVTFMQHLVIRSLVNRVNFRLTQLIR